MLSTHSECTGQRSKCRLIYALKMIMLWVSKQRDHHASENVKIHDMDYLFMFIFLLA